MAVALQEKTLRFPFIIKPNKGSKGEGVALIHDLHEIDRSNKPLKDLVFQNFIKNSGDYRVFILGGRVLGIIKRTAKEGGFLNNISQGGAAEVITDPKIQSTLRRIGTTIASVFELTICGVDVIYDEEEKKYYFLEVNTVPQWKGFQTATGINVAKEIVLFCKRLSERGRIPLPEVIKKEYADQLHNLNGKKFHFLSRLFLWTGEEYYQRQLLDLQKEYIGETETEYRATLRKISLAQPTSGSRALSKHDRLRYFQKYPRLEMLLGLLFKVLFVEKIYGINIRPLIKEIVADEELVQLKQSLENDIEALHILSTHAINYLYLLEFYLETEVGAANPRRYLEIGDTCKDNPIHLKIYFFTHCIIGASKFYSEKIPPKDLVIYTEMLDAIATLIERHYQEISLDNKFEFLVCARICGITPSLEARIIREAVASLSPDGNFLIDKFNTQATKGKNNFVTAEHRNVLFIMSQTPWQRGG